ncbi:MAG: thiamine-phosphate kinase [Deltaproteobacteria bacterium]|nr:MAG: thiamine-phosphate kinase [Deltaproteobacteria bacterium]
MSEREIIGEISRRFQKTTSRSRHLVCGIGDDCAVFRQQAGSDWLISTDMLVENIHFDLSFHPPYKLGRKIVAVNLSDIAAMGGLPEFMLISVSLPKYIGRSWLADLLAGIDDMSAGFGCQLIGGDTVGGGELSFSVTVIGKTDGITPIYRYGAKAGDRVYITGSLGQSGAGLEILRGGLQADDPELAEKLIEAHLNPEPQIKTGRMLAERALATAMQDVSDGITTDLAHICSASKVGAVIYEHLLPGREQLERICAGTNFSALDLMIAAGEDYQLVFTSPSRRLAENTAEITRIGEVVCGSGVRLVRLNGTEEDIAWRGFEH